MLSTECPASFGGEEREVRQSGEASDRQNLRAVKGGLRLQAAIGTTYIDRLGLGGAANGSSGGVRHDDGTVRLGSQEYLE